MRKIAFLLVLIALTVAGVVEPSLARVAKPADALLDGLPDGTAVVLLDFQKISHSSLWTAINAQDKLKSAIDKAQSEMADLGVQLTDVHTVAIVFSPAGLNNPTVALSGGFEQNNLLSRLRANGKIKLTSEKYKNFEVYTVTSVVPAASKELSVATPGPAKDETSFVFYDPSTIVIGDFQNVHASVDVKTGARSGVAQNPRLTDALAQSPAAAIRFALTVTPAMTSSLQSSEAPIPDVSSVSLIFGSIDVASGIDLVATLRSDNAEHARAIAERLNGLLTMARGFLGGMSDPKIAPIAEALKTVNIASADADVRITGSLPMELLNSLLSSTKKIH